MNILSASTVDKVVVVVFSIGVLTACISAPHACQVSAEDKSVRSLDTEVAGSCEPP